MIDSVTNTGKLDRLPPNSTEAEAGVLGCQLLSPRETIDEVVTALKGDYKAHYDLRHQTIQEHLFLMHNQRVEIDLITVQQSLKDRGLLDQVGGIAYLSQLQDSVPSAANLSYYLGIIKEKYLLRKLVNTCSHIVGSVYDYEGDINELLDKSEKEFMAINDLRANSCAGDTGSFLTGAVDRIEAKFVSKGVPSGICTGFDDIDRQLDGLHGGEMIIIAARPSLGKSSLMMNWAEHMAVEAKIPVGVMSLEMGGESLMQRSISSVGRVQVRTPWDHGEAEQARMFMAASKLRVAAGRLIIDDSAGLSILEVRARARRMVQKHGIKVLFIDYLQLIHGVSKKAENNRQVEISEISQGLKALAKELNIAVVVLSQLNRELEKNKRKPRISDLRESGSLEQDADVICLLSHDVDEDDEPNPYSIKANLDIAKQRNGPTGDVKLVFMKAFTRFELAPKFDNEDVKQPHND